MDAQQIFVLVFGSAGGLAGLASLLKIWTDLRREGAQVRQVRRRDEAELVRIAQDVAGAMLREQREEIERLRDRIDAVEAEFAQHRQESARMIADKEAEIALLRGQLRAKEAKLLAYEHLMDAAGVEYPKTAPPASMLSAGGVTPIVDEDPFSLGAGR